jgi:hypothetical protein
VWEPERCADDTLHFAGPLKLKRLEGCQGCVDNSAVGDQHVVPSFLCHLRCVQRNTTGSHRCFYTRCLTNNVGHLVARVNLLSAGATDNWATIRSRDSQPVQVSAVTSDDCDCGWYQFWTGPMRERQTASNATTTEAVCKTTSWGGVASDRLSWQLRRLLV